MPRSAVYNTRAQLYSEQQTEPSAEGDWDQIMDQIMGHDEKACSIHPGQPVEAPLESAREGVFVGR